MEQRRILIAIVGTLAVLGGGALVLWRPGDRAVRPSPLRPEEPPIAVVRRELDGEPLTADAVEPARVAIVIDNAPDSRPQSGIASVPVVIEVPVEGGRSRFLAVFPLDADIGEVGPVRSARPYLERLAVAFRAPLAHVGGSPASLTILRRTNARHIDQYFDPPFRRVTFRRAPFNVYTSIPSLAAFVDQRGWLDALRTAAHDHRPWAYDTDGTAVPQGSEEGTAVPFSFGVTQGAWTYDPAAQGYVRAQAGQVHRDADGQPIIAANVIVVRVRTRILDAIGRVAIPLLEGRDVVEIPVDVYRGGIRSPATWRFGGPNEENEFRTVVGDPALATPLLLVPGRTWIEVVPGGTLGITSPQS